MHKEFAVYQLNEAGVKKAQELALLFDETLTEVEEICSQAAAANVTVSGCVSPSTFITPANVRELAIVRTKLEEASFFAKKALALLPENQR